MLQSMLNSQTRSTHPTDDYTETRGVWKPSPQHKLFRATATREYCCHERLYATNARMKDFPGEHYLKLHTASPSLLFSPNVYPSAIYSQSKQ